MYKWIAYYSDGTKLEQEHGTDKYSKIDRTKLAAFGLEKDGNLIYRLFLEDGQKLIYRYKGRKTLNIVTEEQKQIPGYFMIGYQENIHGKNRQCITYIDEETGLIQTAGRFAAGSEIVFREEEKIA